LTEFRTLFLILVIAFSLIAAHESDHYLAGMIAGIPARDMRIVLLAFPQHVQGVSRGSDLIQGVRPNPGGQT
jgi:hypothetical protein